MHTLAVILGDFYLRATQPTTILNTHPTTLWPQQTNIGVACSPGCVQYHDLDSVALTKHSFVVDWVTVECARR